MADPAAGGPEGEAEKRVTPSAVRKLVEPVVLDVTLDLGQFPVTIYEPRPGYVVMRCYVGGRHKRKAIGRLTLRDDRGALLSSVVPLVKDKATAWYRQLTGAEPMTAVAPKAAVTIGETWALIVDPATGKYPHRTPFRDELHRSLDYAVAAWGSDTTWTSIDSDRWTALMRARLTEQVTRGRIGLRSTEITVSRILTAANWLRKKKRIPIDAAILDPEWRKELAQFWQGAHANAALPEPFRPRHTDEEARKLLGAAWDVDPRFGLLMALGAELRLGQVARAKRSDLDLDANTFTVRGRGDKKGETIDLTAGQHAAVNRALTGYLHGLDSDETRSDYPLFPAGKLLGKKAGDPVASVRSSDPIASNTIRKWYRDAETLAGVARVKGRGAYGVRRVAVDFGLKEHISESGLKSLGGWSSGDMPRRVYADQENKAGRSEAASVRAKFRGEPDA